MWGFCVSQLDINRQGGEGGRGKQLIGLRGLEAGDRLRDLLLEIYVLN